jgi:hypothetical protein
MKGKQMAHYKVKGKSRLATRTTTTNPEWLRVCSQIGRLVNDWSWRSDLVVYGGEDSAEGKAIAAFYSDIAEIEVNLPKAFGELTPADFVGDLTKKETQYEYPMVTGVLYHEALHARHTNWDTPVLAEALDPNEQRAFMLLEESRIEAKGVKERPELRNFLRASALDMALDEVTSDSLADLSGDVWNTARLAGLSISRVDSGVLEVSDITDIYKEVVSVLGQDLFDELRKVWIEFQSLGVPQIERAIELAKKWVELLRESDPEGEPDSGSAGSVFGEPDESEGEGEGGSGSELSDTMKDMIEKLSESASHSEIEAREALAEQEQQAKWGEESKARQEQAKNNNQRKEVAKQVFHKPHSQEGSGSNSSVSSRRQPTGAERASAVEIAKSLDKAKYRERSVHVRKSQTPQGKLIMRNAVQNRAVESIGMRGELPAWKSKTRKHTDDPTLRLGIMVDISGSMGSAMEAMGQTAWIMSEAGRRIQAETAMVYYGSGVFPTLKRGQRLSEVTIYTAPDGTEKFTEAFEALDGELGLTFGDGVRMLVVVSDGNYTGKELQRATELLRECKQNGVAVLWITPTGCSGMGARTIMSGSAWGVHLDNLNTTEIARQVGKSASEALGRVGSLT